MGDSRRVEGLSQNDKPSDEPVNTQKELAASVGMSTGQFAKGEQVKKKDPALWDKAKAGEVSIAQAYKAVTTPKQKPAPSPAPEDEPDPLVVDESKRRTPTRIVEDEGMNIWLLAKSHLDRINKHDTQREQALKACAEYCNNRLQSHK
jgi:hypothetical protein